LTGGGASGDRGGRVDVLALAALVSIAAAARRRREIRERRFSTSST
jgi:hypothetical protein